MEALPLIGIYTLALAIPAAIMTALLATLARSLIDAKRRAVLVPVVGLVAPSAMLLWGWWHLANAPEDPTDMIPPGPGLMMAALPAAALCLLASWLILRRR